MVVNYVAKWHNKKKNQLVLKVLNDYYPRKFSKQCKFPKQIIVANGYHTQEPNQNHNTMHNSQNLSQNQMQAPTIDSNDLKHTQNFF